MTTGAQELTIFDCDGVLVDSEAIAIELEVAYLAEIGIEVTADYVADHYVGLSYPDVESAIFREFGKTVPEGLFADVQTATLARFPTELKAVDGIERVLDFIEGPLCVGSSSGLERIQLSLDVTELARYFAVEHVFSAQMVRNGKPAPDLFLHAAKQLGVSPDSCVVIEDSPHGVEAGRAAGMTVFGFTAASHTTPALSTRLVEAGADAVAATADELVDLLRNL